MSVLVQIWVDLNTPSAPGMGHDPGFLGGWEEDHGMVSLVKNNPFLFLKKIRDYPDSRGVVFGRVGTAKKEKDKRHLQKLSLIIAMAGRKEIESDR